MNLKETLYTNDTRESLKEWAKSGHLYALIDAIFDFPTYDKIRLDYKDTDPQYFEMIAWDQVTFSAPYLVKVDEFGLNWLLNTLSTERWGVFFESAQPLKVLGEHLQKFIIARGPDANPYFLRFHDASVLEVLLRTWEPEERKAFFAPIKNIGLPNLETMNVDLAPNVELIERKLPVMPKPEECLINLTREQLTACTSAIEKDLVRLIYWHLRNYHARAVQHLELQMMFDRISYGIARARSYGLQSISDLAGFVSLMFELAPNFDSHPKFKEILEDAHVPSDFKLRHLAEVITDREWREAQLNYDREFWHKKAAK